MSDSLTVIGDLASTSDSATGGPRPHFRPAVSEAASAALQRSSRTAKSDPSPYPAIDAEVSSWMPPRSPEELARLADTAPMHIEQPLLVWRHEGRDVVLEDADTVELCRQLGKVPSVKVVTFATADEARCFVLDRQLAGRNLHGLRLHYVRGARYNLERAPGRRNDLVTSHQREGKSAPTAEMRFGCSTASIERDGRLARLIDNAAETHGPRARGCLLSFRCKLTAAHIERFAALSVAAQSAALHDLEQGALPDSLKQPAPASSAERAADAKALRARAMAKFSKATALLVELEPIVTDLLQLEPDQKADVASKLADIAKTFAALAGQIQVQHEPTSGGRKGSGTKKSRPERSNSTE